MQHNELHIAKQLKKIHAWDRVKEAKESKDAKTVDKCDRACKNRVCGLKHGMSFDKIQYISIMKFGIWIL